jgi:GT2 family glycosyltransferase
MYDITASIVVFKSHRGDLERAITSFLSTELSAYLYVVDNSPTDDLRSMCNFKNSEYIFNNNNLGFGAGHNVAIRKMAGKTKYTLIMNPDVYFRKGNLEKMFDFMEKNEEVGLVMPKVLYPDGSLQYICRLLPSPYDMFIKKVNIRILKPFLDPQRFRHELRSTGYNKVMDVPYLSGCFMLVRNNVFEKTGIFDERFFMHFEDADLTRRIHKLYRTVYYPEATIYHVYEGSDKDPSIFMHLVASGIKYFNKWGWFRDKERAIMNKKALRSFFPEMSSKLKMEV